MDQNERRVIDELFGKLRQVDGRAPSRDPEAEAYIRQQIAAVPAAPYYMAQAIVVQEQALAASQARVQDLERRLAERPAGGGFLAGLFGGGGSERLPAAGAGHAAAGAPTPGRPQIPPHYYRGGGGGGFLAGAMQTAVGVAGGVLIGNALAGLFAPDEAAAAEPAPEEAADAGWGEDAAYEEPSLGDDGGSFFDDTEF
jgi:uncharacterized protein